jgi:hypothetical protein
MGSGRVAWQLLQGCMMQVTQQRSSSACGGSALTELLAPAFDERCIQRCHEVDAVAACLVCMDLQLPWICSPGVTVRWLAEQLLGV